MEQHQVESNVLLHRASTLYVEANLEQPTAQASYKAEALRHAIHFVVFNLLAAVVCCIYTLKALRALLLVWLLSV